MLLTAHKKLLSLTALALAATMLLSGTFAWQNLNQEALNELRGIANPGGRLHDDFNNVSYDTNADGTLKYSTKTYNKDVYVENFTTALDDGVNIYVRIRLDEYMEIGTGAGTNSTTKDVAILGGPTASLTDRSTWTTYIPGQNSAFREYWTWKTDGGQTTYMPTFNKNKDSLAADINGTSALGFADYVDYTKLDSKTETGYAIYDLDDNDVDELTNGNVDLDKLIDGTLTLDPLYESSVRLNKETHEIDNTLLGTVITMEEWQRGDPYGHQQEPGNYWVWDSDGWAYWANPVKPGEATGLLLDQIARTEKIIDHTEWYYGINVVAQFITADSLGDRTNGGGFFDTARGAAPSNNALMLLTAIGVDTSKVDSATPIGGSALVSNADELLAAVETSSDITLIGDVELAQTVSLARALSLNLNGYTIRPAADFQGGSLFSVTGGAEVNINDQGLLCAPDCGYVAQVQGNSTLYIWGGTFAGSAGALYVGDGTVLIVDGTFYCQDSGALGQLLNWDAASTATLAVCGGTFYNFDPSNVSGVDLLVEGYSVAAETDGVNTVYAVQFAQTSGAAQSEEGQQAAGEAGQTPADADTGSGEQGAGDAQQPAAPADTDSGSESSGVVGSGISGRADVVPGGSSADTGSIGSETTGSTDADSVPAEA